MAASVCFLHCCILGYLIEDCERCICSDHVPERWISNHSEDSLETLLRRILLPFQVLTDEKPIQFHKISLHGHPQGADSPKASAKELRHDCRDGRAKNWPLIGQQAQRQSCLFYSPLSAKLMLAD